MIDTLIEDEDHGLTREDCLEFLGEGGRQMFDAYMMSGQQRIGQAWFNALSVTDDNESDKLVGTFFDPFYRDSWADVIRALAFLLRS